MDVPSGGNDLLVSSLGYPDSIRRSPDRPSDRRPSQAISDPDDVRSTAEPEITEAQESPPTPLPDPPVDPGAAELMQSFLQTLGEPMQGEDGVTRIAVNSLHNQSRSTRDDFRALLRFLLDHLNRAGGPHRIMFTDAEEAIVQYRLEGAAYRIGGNGQSQWELFLRIQQDEDGMLIWEGPGPVHVTLGDDAESPVIRFKQN